MPGEGQGGHQGGFIHSKDNVALEGAAQVLVELPSLECGTWGRGLGVTWLCWVKGWA